MHLFNEAAHVSDDQAATMRTSVPTSRLRPCNDAPIRGEGEFVVYWMTTARRLRWNFGLQQAVYRAEELGRPLVVLEALRCGYPWASDRLHRFVMDGMREHEATLKSSKVAYYPYIEDEEGAGAGLLEALGARACVVVTDDFPAFFLPRMLAAAARRLQVRLEAVDSNGLYPMRATRRRFTVAHSFRRHLHREFVDGDIILPHPDPLAEASLKRLDALPPSILGRWPAAPAKVLRADATALAALPIDHGVPPVDATPGGEQAGRARMEAFFEERLARYDEARNEPALRGSSGLSPYLHFGHISPHEIFAALVEREGWTPADIDPARAGKREGWWGMSAPAEAFLDQLVTWRELAFNGCVTDPEHYDDMDSLPSWARQTLAEHAADARPKLYELEDFAAAETHEPVWNAAQRQLLREGTIHNYMRMLWGKKILHWTEDPARALAILVELNDRFALDGRDPNSYANLLWVLGKYDRAWGPERPVFGKVRYMSCASARRKYDLDPYLQRYDADPEGRRESGEGAS